MVGGGTHGLFGASAAESLVGSRVGSTVACSTVASVVCRGHPCLCNSYTCLLVWEERRRVPISACSRLSIVKRNLGCVIRNKLSGNKSSILRDGVQVVQCVHQVDAVTASYFHRALNSTIGSVGQDHNGCLTNYIAEIEYICHACSGSGVDSCY
jgi:hypothetical protein